MRVQQLTVPDVIDPQKSSFTSEIAILSLNYEGLTKLDSKLQAVPAAAESWKFNDKGDELTFTLRDGLKYSDGSPLTSKNFLYSIVRTCDPNTAGEYQFILAEIKGCGEYSATPVTDTAGLEKAKATLLENALTPDDKTLTLKLTHPAPYFPYIAGLWVMYPAKQELIEKGGETWYKDPANQIGNGPFQWKTYDEGQLATFEANTNYWEGKPKLDKIEFVYQKDTAVALEAYKAGQLDIIQPDPSQLPAVKSDPALEKELLLYAGANTFGQGFNLNKEPFTDPKVREAFAYAFDRDTYCADIRNGDCVAAYSWVPADVNGGFANEDFKFDPAKAKEALAASSYGSADKLPPITLTYNSDDPANTPRVEWVAGQLRDVLGIEVTLEPMEGKALTAARKSNETYPQMCFFCNNWYQDYPDPQNWLSLYWSCEGFATRVGYCNKDFDKLVQQADVELDPAKRTELYKQAGMILVKDQPGNFGYHRANKFLVKPYVKGYSPTSADSEIPGQWGSALNWEVTP